MNIVCDHWNSSQAGGGNLGIGMFAWYLLREPNQGVATLPYRSDNKLQLADQSILDQCKHCEIEVSQLNLHESAE